MRKRWSNIQRPWLLPLTPIYGIGVMIRNLLFDLHVLRSVSFRLPIISVGNITVGGTGKTPHVEMMVRLLRKDYRLAVLSRGYKRKSKGFVLATGRCRVSDIGDEPLQIKQKFPEIQVAVDSNRVSGVTRLLNTRHKPDLIILDDAYQHRYIKPGFSILLIDYNRPVFRDFMLPAGNLREPARNSRRADVVIVTKCPPDLSQKKRARFTAQLRLNPGQELYFTSYSYRSPEPVYPAKRGKDTSLTFRHLRKSHAGILLVTGVADPGPVLRFLQEFLHVHDSLFFPDHHPYDGGDLQQISDRFQALPGEEKYILVTEKDAIRFRELETDELLRRSMYYIPVKAEFLDQGEKQFCKQVSRYLRKAMKA